MALCSKLKARLILPWLIVGASIVAQEPVTTPEPVARPTVSMIELTGEAARYWPRWRGPSGQGIVDGEGYPDRWSTSENVLWRVAVPGRDNSSPIVWGDKIFVTTTETDGHLQPRSLLCYRATDGKLLWQTFAPSPEERLTQRRVTLSIGTPVTDGERVYAYLGNSGLIAVDFEGNQIWHSRLGTFDHATSSPLLYKDIIVILQVSSSREDSFVKAYNKKGQAMWQTMRQESLACGSPIAIRVGEEDQIVISGQEFVRAYNPVYGRRIWDARGTTPNAIPTPVVGAGMVFVTSGKSGPTLAIHPTGKGDVTSSHIAWQTEETGPLAPSPVFYDDYLFVVDDSSGKVNCFDSYSGELVWSHQVADPRGGGLVASPVVVEGKLFVTDVHGETFILRAGPEFEFLGSNRLEAQIRSSPALSEGRWYFRSDRELIAIGHP